MTWILIIVAFAVGNLPDERMEPPQTISGIESLAACHKVAHGIAYSVSRASAQTVSLVYDCAIEGGPES